MKELEHEQKQYENDELNSINEVEMETWQKIAYKFAQEDDGSIKIVILRKMRNRNLVMRMLACQE